MKKQKKLGGREMISINENLYDMFSVDELEQRLQMSALAPWICGTHDNTCSPITKSEDTPPATCSPVANA